MKRRAPEGEGGDEREGREGREGERGDEREGRRER